MLFGELFLMGEKLLRMLLRVGPSDTGAEVLGWSMEMLLAKSSAQIAMTKALRARCIAQKAQSTELRSDAGMIFFQNCMVRMAAAFIVAERVNRR